VSLRRKSLSPKDIGFLKAICTAEMSIAAEELPLPRRDVRKKSYRAAMVYKKKLPRRCRDATAYKKILPRRDGL